MPRRSALVPRCRADLALDPPRYHCHKPLNERAHLGARAFGFNLGEYGRESSVPFKGAVNNSAAWFRLAERLKLGEALAKCDPASVITMFFGRRTY